MSSPQLCLTKKQLCFDSWWFVQLPSLGSVRFVKQVHRCHYWEGGFIWQNTLHFLWHFLSPHLPLLLPQLKWTLVFPYRRRRWLKPSHQSRYGGWVGTGPGPQDLYVANWPWITSQLPVTTDLTQLSIWILLFCVGRWKWFAWLLSSESVVKFAMAELMIRSSYNIITDSNSRGSNLLSFSFPEA